ncbi:MAG: sodium-independent anion transporter [Denitrovibrio sp.]|nr:MAG: sodium-independent anion transporter [Denitrovibrio sp.]
MYSFFAKRTTSFKADILSGITVALALVPEAIAFAFIAGVAPLVGLYTAFIIGFITSVLGGLPGMISGATGAIGVVVVSLVATHGVEYLFAAVVLMGLIQIAAGVLRLGKFVRMIPHPVMLGFVNGLAIIIFLAQLSQFKIKNADGILTWMQGDKLFIMLGLCLLTMCIVHCFTKITKAIPSPLVAIVVVTLIVHFFNLDTRTVGDLASLKGGLPIFHIPMISLSMETLYIILPYSAVMAAVGLIESLMTMTLIDEITETRGKGNRECIGQGVANTVTGFFGGMGGCAMIGQSMINVTSGGRGRLSSLSASIFLLSFILFASGLIELIPLAALTGIMFMVVIGTFAWASLRVLNKVQFTDAFIIVLVSGVTVATDLAVAVAVGVIISALVFAWESSKNIQALVSAEGDTKIYQLVGAVFFGSTQSFNRIFDVENDPDHIIIDFMRSRVYDHSGIEAISNITEKYKLAGKKLSLRHLSPDCIQLLNNANDIIEVNVIADPRYHVATDKLA